MRFELFVASRYLRAKRRQAVIGVITAISVIGVAAGVASLIIALSITNGFRQDLQNRLLGASAHVQLLRVAGDGIRDWPAVLAKLEKQPHVVSAAPALYEQVLISRGAQAQGANLHGVVPDHERKVSDLRSFVKIGSADPLRQQPERAQPKPATQQPAPYPTSYPAIVLGKDLADKLNASAGSIVLVTSPQGELTPFGIVPKYMHFKVVGLMQAGFYDYDISWALARLADAHRPLGLGDVVSVIEFKVDDIYRV